MRLRFTTLPPLARRIPLLAIDACLLQLAGWLSFWLRLAHPFHDMLLIEGSWLLPAALILGLPVFWLTGQYKGLTRYVGSRALYELSGRTGLLTLLLVFLGVLFDWPSPPRSAWVLFWVLLTGLCGAVRFALRDLLLGWQRGRPGARTRVVIYGAGAAGAQLAAALRFGEYHDLLAFIDDDPQLWGRSLAGVDVFAKLGPSG